VRCPPSITTPCDSVNLGRTVRSSLLSAWAHGHVGHVWPFGPKRELATIHAALDAGITLIDTGDFYGMGHNEMLIAEALKGMPRDKYVLSVKFGALRDPAAITPRVLTEALAAGGDEARRAFEAMMGMKKIDVAAIKVARRG
jgi:aryl-alcohol dehydrogenase-like predicted oxidoreductase